MTRIWLIRHGAAHVNHVDPDGSAYTLIDREGLTDQGRRQAELLRDRLTAERVTPDAVVSSTFPRARQTAEILCQALDLHPHLADDLQEWRPGDDVEQLPVSEAFDIWSRILRGHDHDVRISPRSESHSDFVTRADEALRRVAREYDGQLVLVVTHGGVIDRSLVTYLGLPHLSSLSGLAARHTSITEWRQVDGFGEPTWRLERYNDAAHLPG
jgi:probable phosphoglycerate mutase